MVRKRHKLTPLSLSFLDIMSCGLGAVVLLFLIIKHNVEAHVPVRPELSAEVNRLEEEVLEGQEGLAELRNTTAELDQQIVVAKGLARRLQEEQQRDQRRPDAATTSVADEIAVLQARVEDLEQQKQQIEEELKATGEDARTFAGAGSRRYLTGLKLDGQRILLLLDTSASMLDRTIVNVIRRKHMPPARKLRSEKWRQAVRMVDWLTARFPVGSQYQVYAFNTQVKSALPGTEGTWLSVGNLSQFNVAVAAVREIVPEGGTSLENAFLAVKDLRPRPDNIILITDGLPTQGQKPPSSATTISGSERLKLFHRATRQLPGGIPVNVILAPMEGDPAGAHAFWGLAVLTKGSFMTPARDWP